jgi:hypothetical protein
MCPRRGSAGMQIADKIDLFQLCYLLFSEKDVAFSIPQILQKCKHFDL